MDQRLEKLERIEEWFEHVFHVHVVWVDTEGILFFFWSYFGAQKVPSDILLTDNQLL
jgi:hypothetical protein